MIHVRHAAAAIAAGLCGTVLITYGESGRSGVGRTRNTVGPTSLTGQFEQPYGPMGPLTLFTIPVLGYMIFPVTPAKSGAQGRATRSRNSGFPLSGNDEIKVRAIGDGLGGAARMGRKGPARHTSGHRSPHALIAVPTIGAGSDAR
jgi:hypothetical protein